MSKQKYPAFKLQTYDSWFDEQCYVDGDNAWLVENLWEEAAGLPTYDVPIIGMFTDVATWNGVPNYMEFLSHCKLILEADLSYPIILTPEGSIADGRHRLGKAIIEGHSTIKIQRLVSMPDPDFTYDEDGNAKE
jgi:hypothetical protein